MEKDARYSTTERGNGGRGGEEGSERRPVHWKSIQKSEKTHKAACLLTLPVDHSPVNSQQSARARRAPESHGQMTSDSPAEPDLSGLIREAF